MLRLSRRHFLQAVTGAAALTASSSLALAQGYPQRTVRVIVPFPPGGTTDIFARIATQKLSERLGQQFIVENIGGASGNIGTGQAARAAADGYTVLIAFSSFVINPSLFDHIPYDPYKDFAPITLAVSSPSVLSVNPAVPAHTVKELVELIQATPGKYNFAAPGIGTPSHLAGEQMRQSLHLDVVQVPYSGAGPAVTAIMGGHSPIGFSTIASAATQIKSGTLRALAITGKTRSPILPNVPTMTEAGYPQIEGDSWVGVMVPAKTPNEIVQLLHREFVAVIALPDVKERLVTLGFDPVASTPEEFRQRIAVEITLWGKVIGAGHLKP